MRSRKALKPKNKIKDPRPRDYRSYGTLREGKHGTADDARPGSESPSRFSAFQTMVSACSRRSYLSAKKRAFESPYTDRFSPPLTEQMIRGVRYRGDRRPP